jgi:O-antigen/teichoic acid export membrane protein
MTLTPDPIESIDGPDATAALARATGAPPLSAEDEHSSHRARRLRRLKLSIASSLVIRPLALLIPIVTVPLFLRYLGVEGYGLFEAVGAIAMYLSITSLGLTGGLQNKLTDCDVSGDRELARRYVSSLWVALLVMTLVTVVAYSVLIPLVNWRWLLKLEEARSDITWAVWVAGMVTMAGLVASMPNAIYGAYQEFHRANVWEGISKVSTIVACIAVTFTPWGLVGVLLAVSGTPAIVRIVNLAWLFFIEKKWLSPKFGLFDWKLLKATASEGILLFVLQMSVVLLFQTDKLIIANRLGAQEVAGYAILGRLFIAAYGVYVILLGPLWPASGEAVRRGDIAWVRRTQRISQWVGMGISLAMGIALLTGGNLMRALLQRISGGGEFDISANLICAVTATFMTRAWVDSRSITLNSTGVLAPQIVFYTGHAVLNFVVAILAVRRFGVEGVAWATPITAIVTSVWGYPYMMRRYIFSREEAASNAGASGTAAGASTPAAS